MVSGLSILPVLWALVYKAHGRPEQQENHRNPSPNAAKAHVPSHIHRYLLIAHDASAGVYICICTGHGTQECDGDGRCNGIGDNKQVGNGNAAGQVGMVYASSNIPHCHAFTALIVFPSGQLRHIPEESATPQHQGLLLRALPACAARMWAHHEMPHQELHSAEGQGSRGDCLGTGRVDSGEARVKKRTVMVPGTVRAVQIACT